MSLLSLIIALALVGFVMYIINTMIPMPPLYKKWMNILVVFFLIIWFLNAMGLLAGLGGIRI